jgi:hypothetical protein
MHLQSLVPIYLSLPILIKTIIPGLILNLYPYRKSCISSTVISFQAARYILNASCTIPIYCDND